MFRRIPITIFSYGGAIACSANGLANPLTARSHYLIPPRIHGFHPFGLIPQGDAGHAMEISLFLHPAGIGEDAVGVFFQLHHIQEGDGGDEPYVSDG